MKRTPSRCWLLVLAALVLHAPPALACAVCFGQSDSSLAKGMNSGILFLLGVVAFVLGCLVSVIVMFALRSRQLTRTQQALAADPSEGFLPPESPSRRTGFALVGPPGRSPLVSPSAVSQRPTCRPPSPR